MSSEIGCMLLFTQQKSDKCERTLNKSKNPTTIVSFWILNFKTAVWLSDENQIIHHKSVTANRWLAWIKLLFLKLEYN